MRSRDLVLGAVVAGGFGVVIAVLALALPDPPAELAAALHTVAVVGPLARLASPDHQATPRTLQQIGAVDEFRHM